MASLEGLDPEFEYKLRRFMSSLPASVRNRVTLNSGYRSPERQAFLFDRAVRKYGSVAAARKWVAPPGKSMHNAGKAADLGIPNDLVGLIHREAPAWGLKFPLSNESWHIEDSRTRDGGGSGSGGIIDLDQGSLSLSGGSGSDTLRGNEGQDNFIQSLDPMRSQAPNARQVPYQPMIEQAAQAFQLDPRVLTNLVGTESSFNAAAVSPAGARGLTQIMPGTAKHLGVNPDNPKEAIYGGAKYLREMADRYKGNMELALAAYNWGPGNVDKIGGDLSKAPSSVQGYVKKIMAGLTDAAPENTLTDLGQQAAAGVVDIGVSLPAAAAIPFTAAAESVGHDVITPQLRARGVELPSVLTDTDVTGWLENLAEGGTKLSETITGAQEPKTWLQQLVRNATTLGGAGAVFGGAPGAIGGGLTGALGATINYLNANPNKPEDYVYNQPGMAAGVAPGMESLVQPSAVMNRLPAPVEPSSSLLGMTDSNDIFNLKKVLPLIEASSLAPAVAASMIPNLSTIFGSSPETVKKAYERYGTLGWIVLGMTAAFGVGPKGARFVASIKPARMSDLLRGTYRPTQASDLVHEIRPDVAPGVWNPKTRTVDPVQHVLKATDPIKAMAVDTSAAVVEPIRRYLQKAGMNTDFIHELEMAWQHDAAFMANLNSFFRNGEMNTVIGRMKVARDSTMAILQKAAGMDADVVKYLNLLRKKDDFLVAKKRVIGGQTRADVIRDIQLLERAKPNLVKVADIAKANRSAHIQFLRDAGEITQKEANWMVINRPNSIDPEKVPKNLGRRNPAEPTPGDISALDEHTIGIMDGSRNAFDTVTNRKTAEGAAKTGLRLIVKIPKKKAQAWKGGPSIVVIKNVHGEKEYYATNPTWAVLMRHGPDKPRGIVTGELANVADPIGGYKRIQEIIGTGEFNPGYYGVAQSRARGQIHQTFRGFSQPRTPIGGIIPYGRQGRPIGILGTKLATPRAIFPAIARNAAQNMEAALLTNTSLRWLPDAHRQALAMRLSDMVEQSAIYKLETHGGIASGSFVSDAARSNYKERMGIGLKVPSKARSLWHGYQDLLFTSHGAASLGFAMKELGVRLRQGQSLEKAAMEAAYSGANVTGNPRMTGASSMRGEHIPGRPARQGRKLLSKDGEAGKLERLATEAVRAGSGLGRYGVPWYNVQVQSMRNVWNAYTRNPVGFMMSLYGYSIAPAIATYLWNAGLGKEYVDHMMDGRSAQRKLTSLYVGIPGRDPADGHEWPGPQEISIFPAATLIMMDHMLRGDQVFPTQDDMWRMLGQYVKGVLIPSPPEVATIADTVAKGIGQAYDSYNQPFQEPGDVPQPFEGMLGSLIGPMAHAVVQSYEAFADEKGSYGEKIKAGAKELAREAGKTIPAIREGFNIPIMPITQTQYKIELDKKEQAINTLSAYWSAKGKAYFNGEDPSVDTSAASKRGEAIFEEQGGDEFDTSTEVGKGGKTSTPYLFPSVEPDNPDWWELAGRIQQNFASDDTYKLSDVRDIDGYATWHKKRNAFRRVVQDMKGKPNYGNVGNWKQHIVEDPYFAEVVKDLSPKDRNAPDYVFRYATNQLNKMNLRLIKFVLEAEASMSEDRGKEIKLEKVSPWIKGWLP